MSLLWAERPAKLFEELDLLSHTPLPKELQRLAARQMRMMINEMPKRQQPSDLIYSKGKEVLHLNPTWQAEDEM